MKKLKTRYTVLTLSTMLLSTYVSPLVQNNSLTSVYAQDTLTNATYTTATPIEATSFNEALQHFSLYHDAHPSLDFSSIILTEDEAGEYGAIYLSEKIDIQQPFSISGKINLGDKVTSSHSSRTDIKGGDGISFLFLDAYVGVFGKPGESLGLGKIKNSFGFKLDTHYNPTLPSGNDYADSDPTLFGAKDKAFGSFIYSNYRGNVSTLDASVIDDKPNHTFVPFSLTYGGKDDPTITVVYGGKTFTRKVDARLNKSDSPIRAFGIFASTIDGTNQQQIKIESLRYTGIRPKIVIQYINNITGETIQSPKTLTGQLGSTKELVGTSIIVPHYKLIRHNLSTAPGFQSGDTITLLNGTQTVTYAYAPIYNELYPLVAKENNQVQQNQAVTPQDMLQNADTLPTGTTLSWKNPIDTSSVGQINAVIVATYPDNTTTELPISIQVIADSNTSDILEVLSKPETSVDSETLITLDIDSTSEIVVTPETATTSEMIVATERAETSVLSNKTETKMVNKNNKQTKTQKKTLPKTGHATINIIYPVIAFISASILMMLSRVKSLKKTK